MKRNLLGRTGLEVSAISLGTVELGMNYGLPGSDSRPTVAEAERLIHRALDAGVNHLDTARGYGDAEAVIGAALGARRRDVILTTKVVIGGELQAITESVETSLRLLRTDYIDVLMLHSAPRESLTENAATLHLLGLKEKGWFRYLGASVYGVAASHAAIDSEIFDCLQVAYSPLDRRPEAAVLVRAAEAGVGVVARSVLLKGVLSHRYHGLPAGYQELQAAVARLDLLGLPLPELAYRYVLGEPNVATALAGTAHSTELDEVLRYAELGALPAEIQTQIRREPMLADHWLNPGLWPSG